MNINSIKKFKTLLLKIAAATALATTFYSCGPGQNLFNNPATAVVGSINFSPTSGSAGTLMTITSTDTDLLNPTSVSVGGVNAIILESSSTSLTVLSLSSTTGAVVVTPATGSAVTSASDFTFTASSPIATQQGAKLVGTGVSGFAQQGSSVALSADGNTVIVGGQNDNSTRGAAWVYIRNAGVWTQQGAKLVGTGAVGNASQGWSIALSADGNTAIVGGLSDNSNQGAAWVFNRSAGVWTQQGAKLVGTGAVGNAQQGYSVALSADGNTAIVGGFGDNSNQGAAWVFIP
jgi:hypothetical protein